MKFIPTLLLTSALITLSGCSSMKVTSKRNGSFDFSKVKTYEWVQAPANILEEKDTYNNSNMLQALDQELAHKKWTSVFTSDEADIQVSYFIKTEKHTEYAGPSVSEEPRLTGGFTYNRNSGNWNYNNQQPDLNAYTVETGTLTLLILNAESGKLLWTGSLKTRLDRSLPADKLQKIFERIARKMIVQLPKRSI